MTPDGRRGLRTVTAIAALVLALTGCAPQPGPDDWTLEPIAFDSALQDHPGLAPQYGSAGERLDFAFGFHQLAADGNDGFWAVSGGSWLHVGADGETLARFNTEPGEALSRVTAIAGLSRTELVVVRHHGAPRPGTPVLAAPVLAVLDTSTMNMRDIPGGAPSGSGSTADFGGFAFGDVATHLGAAIVVRYQPHPPGPADYEVLRIDLDDGTRSVLFSESLSPEDASTATSDLPPVEIDVDATGVIHLATPSARIVLEPDGTERSRTPQTTSRPRVAVSPDGTALWWGDEKRESVVQGVIVGGSADARASIERRTTCDMSEIIRTEALTMTGGGGEHPLPFLCGANAAIWTGDSWIVAIGGEGDGVLVRLTPPKNP